MYSINQSINIKKDLQDVSAGIGVLKNKVLLSFSTI
jgi:hypothetical protein